MVYRLWNVGCDSRGWTDRESRFNVTIYTFIFCILYRFVLSYQFLSLVSPIPCSLPPLYHAMIVVVKINSGIEFEVLLELLDQD